MIKKIFLTLTYIFIFFNFNLHAIEKNGELKIGLLAPFSGDYKELGDSLLFSIQLALDEINDKKIVIIPRDAGTNDKVKLNNAIEEIIQAGAKVIIGPVDSSSFNELEKYKEVTFISLSNKEPKIKKNIISIGISLESQIRSLLNFIKKEEKKKTIIIYPNNNFADFIDKKLTELNLSDYKTFKYNSDPKILTGEIEKLTNYSQRKRNLDYRKKLLEDKEDEQSLRELSKLEQIYTLGKVSFDSIIIIDFGSSLKSVLASLVFADVNENEVLYTSVNQWFDESIFYENSIKNLYYPSVDYKNFKTFNKKYSKIFNSPANEITILAYDALGLIYYVWKKNNGIKNTSDFYIKDKIKGKIGTFSFKDNKVSQDLKVYKTDNKTFIEK